MKPVLALKLLVLASLLLLVAACNRDISQAQSVVERFLDAHYVHIDLAKAKQFTVGLATAKVEEEIRLTKGQSIDAATRKPRINYKLMNKKENDKRASYVYEGTVQTDDGDAFTRKWLISARAEGDQWRVSNFTESD